MRTVYLRISMDDRQIQSFFDYAGHKIRDAREPLYKIKELVRAKIEYNFATEGGYQWQQLSEGYLARKIADGFGGQPILERTGAGKKDILSDDAFMVTRDTLRFHPGDIYQMAQDSREYMSWHQTGGTVPGRPPQRAFVELSTDDEQVIEEIWWAWLDDLRTANRARGNDIFHSIPLPSINIL